MNYHETTTNRIMSYHDVAVVITADIMTINRLLRPLSCQQRSQVLDKVFDPIHYARFQYIQ